MADALCGSRWTAEGRARIAHLYEKQKLTASQIAARFGETRNAIIGLLWRMGKMGSDPARVRERDRSSRRPTPNKANKRWTPELRDKFAALYKSNTHCQDIAAEFGVRANTVRTLASKFGIARPRHVVRPGFTRSSPGLIRTFPKPPSGLLQPSLSVTFADLKLNQCRYPSGEGAEITFCGHKRWASSPYCAHHHTICYRGRGT